MIAIIGIVLLLVVVFVPYVLSNGSMAVIFHALIIEGPTILGAGVASLLIGNSMTVLKQLFSGLKSVFSGPRWKPEDYVDLLSLLFQITKTMKAKGVVALESHIENPAESPIFSAYPKLLTDHFAIDFICDTIRMMTMNLEDPHQVEDAMEKQLEKHHHENSEPAHALQNLADALPALGIVAAVLGVIKTMGSITEPPAVLGEMIGGALVGTFLGVLLAYGLVGPFGHRITQIVEEESTIYRIIQSVLISHLHGNAAQVSVEIGRTNVPTEHQPTFQDLEEALSNITA